MIGINFINAGELVRDELYLNPFANVKQWYNPYGFFLKENNCQVEYILTKVKVQSINDVDIPNRTSNKLKGDAIRLGDVYVCDLHTMK